MIPAEIVYLCAHDMLGISLANRKHVHFINRKQLNDFIFFLWEDITEVKLNQFPW